MILTSPIEAFRSMHRDGGFGGPLSYAVIGGLAGAIVTAIYNTFFQTVMMASIGGQPGADVFPAAIGMIVFNFAIAFFGGTLGVIISLFISSGIYHLFLMIFGATKESHQTFETTFRVVSYTTGSIALLQVIPLCGQYIYGLVAIVYTILGLSAAHQISGGKASAAVLVPLLFCFVSVLAISMAILFSMRATGTAF